MDRVYQSWGRYPKARQEIVRINWRDESLPEAGNPRLTLLPFGNGRSYGDSCLNDGGALIDTRGLSRFIELDSVRGILRCEAGVLLSEILDLIVPLGWFLSVTPGTRFVTVGGAIANDVHGKNHHRQGTFGRHVLRFELLRSDEQRLNCSEEENRELFRATIGGLGLTGVVVWAEIKLMKISNPYIDVQTIKFSNLREFFELTADSDADFDYTVAWVDCLAKGKSLGRGHFMRANPAPALRDAPAYKRQSSLAVPFTPPVALVNNLSLKTFNLLYYNKQRKKQRREIVHYEPFFYPLDFIRQWNRIYGPHGFMQYQCVVPLTSGPGAIGEILERIAQAGKGSFLAVLKVFGDVASPGMLSFPRPGPTLALDFPNQGSKTLELLDRLDEVVMQAGGTVYPAKDARMSSSSFQRYYPQWKAFSDYIDPRFSSSFWRRVTGS